jgi:hypothetical protein
MVTVMGLTVCLGWYSSLLYEYIAHGRVFNILYENASVLFSFEVTEECDSKCVILKKVITPTEPISLLIPYLLSFCCDRTRQ